MSLWVHQLPRPINTASQDTFLSVCQNAKKPRNQAVSGLIVHEVYAPIWKKYVRATPEEYVRQRTIQFLIDYLGVPQDRIIVERTLSRLGVEWDRRRIDIRIPYQEGETTAVVECKESIVGDHEAACVQAQDYSQALHVKFFFVTDGMTFKGYRFKMMSFLQLEDIPHYEEWGLI